MTLKSIQTPGKYSDSSKQFSIFVGWNDLLVSADEKHKLAIGDVPQLLERSL